MNVYGSYVVVSRHVGKRISIYLYVWLYKVTLDDSRSIASVNSAHACDTACELLSDLAELTYTEMVYLLHTFLLMYTQI